MPVQCRWSGEEAQGSECHPTHYPWSSFDVRQSFLGSIERQWQQDVLLELVGVQRPKDLSERDWAELVAMEELYSERD